MTTLANRWILITGASSGLGKAMAMEFAAAGAHLILNARNAERLGQVQEQAGQSGVECLTVVGDVTEGAVRDSLVKLGLDKELDILINNAGIVSIEPHEEIAPERIEYLIALNLTAPILLTQAFLPMFKARGSGTLVNINSGGGRNPGLHHATYCASKYGLRGFAESLRLEVKGQGIRILEIFPGKMATELFVNAGREMDTAKFIPPEEVAAALLNLLQMSPKCAPAELVIDRMSK